VIRNTLLLITLLLLVLVPVAAQDDDDDTEFTPTDFYTSSDAGARFNIPIPQGWQEISTTDRYARLANPEIEGEMYVIAVEAESFDQAVETGLARIDPDLEIEPVVTGDLRLNGLEWIKTLYNLEGGGTMTAFVQERDTSYFQILFINRDPSREFYLMAVTAEDEDNPTQIDEVIDEIYPDLDMELRESRPVDLRTDTWTLATYDLPEDDELHVLHTVSFGTTYAAIERGDGEMLRATDEAFFVVLFGFFVTPQNDDFLLLGLAASFGITLVFIGSVYLRHRNLSRDMALIKRLEDD
jgi:hypothetical protein